MKKFMSKLESKLDSSSNNNSNSNSSRPYQPPAGAPQSRPAGQYAAPAGPPPQQQQQYGAPPQQQGGGYLQQQYAPQAYSQPPGPPPPHIAMGGAAAPPAGRGGEDPFAALRRYDTVFIVDDSESMEMFWDEVREALVSVVETSVKYDEDGIDVYFFNSPVVVNNVRSAQDVRSLFRRVDPRRSTPTAKALKRVLEPYLASLEQANSAKERGQPVQTVKPLNVVILTDGAPDRGEEPEGVIVNAGKRLDSVRAPPYQLGFSFVQIGADEEAQEALTYLDDHLKTEYGIRDMVDTTLSPPNGSVSSEYLLKALLGGINRKFDKQ